MVCTPMVCTPMVCTPMVCTPRDPSIHREPFLQRDPSLQREPSLQSKQSLRSHKDPLIQRNTSIPRDSSFQSKQSLRSQRNQGNNSLQGKTTFQKNQSLKLDTDEYLMPNGKSSNEIEMNSLVGLNGNGHATTAVWICFEPCLFNKKYSLLNVSFTSKTHSWYIYFKYLKPCGKVV